MDIQLTDVEARVLGALIEKELTTPEYYPLTMNALVAACNQKSNREPVMSLDEKTVMDAVESLRYGGLAWQVTSTGARTAKYKHNLTGRFTLNRPELAVLDELLLRGPQTVGELRGRAARMHPFAALQEAQAAVDSLVNWEGGGMVVRLPCEPGRREARYMHLLSGPPPAAPASAPAAAAGTATGTAETAPSLREELAQLKERLRRLEERLEAHETGRAPAPARDERVGAEGVTAPPGETP